MDILDILRAALQQALGARAGYSILNGVFDLKVTSFGESITGAKNALVDEILA